MQGFKAALDFFLSRRASSQVGVVCVENESILLSNHYNARMRLFTVPALVAATNPPSRPCFNLGFSVGEWQHGAFADSCMTLHSMPPAAVPHAYRHFVTVIIGAPEHQGHSAQVGVLGGKCVACLGEDTPSLVVECAFSAQSHCSP